MYAKLTRFAVGLTVALSLLGAVNVAQASSLTQVQISAIINLLQTFGADQSVISNVQASLGGQASGGQSTPGNPTPNVTGASCLDLPFNLSVGSTNHWHGDGVMDVTELQQFLGVSATGYFGPLTQQAVINWQSAHGISAIGIVGPMTRAAMACSGSTTGTPSATVNLNSIGIGSTGYVSGNPTVVGTASNVSTLRASLTNSGGAVLYTGHFSVTQGSWAWTPLNSDGTLPVLQDGTYTVIINDPQDSTLPPYATATLMVHKSSTSGNPTVTFDQSSFYASTRGTAGGTADEYNATNVTLTGTASGVNLVEVYLVRSDGYAYGQGTLGLDHGATIANGHWSFTARALPIGTYTVTVRLSDVPSGSLPAGAILATTTLTVAMGI